MFRGRMETAKRFVRVHRCTSSLQRSECTVFDVSLVGKGWGKGGRGKKGQGWNKGVGLGAWWGGVVEGGVGVGLGMAWACVEQLWSGQR